MRHLSFAALLLVPVAAQAQRKSPFVSPERPDARSEMAPGIRARLPRPAGPLLEGLSPRERDVLAVRGRVPRIGVHRVIDPKLAAGDWETLPDGLPVWRVAIRSTGASAIRVHFTNFAAGQGKVWVYGDAGQPQSQGPYTGNGTFDNGEFWSGTVWGESAIVEYQPAGAGDRRVPFEIESISHTSGPATRHAAGRAMRFDDASSPVEAAGACNLDVSCYPEWSDAMKMVSEIRFEVEENGQGFEAACTASLVGTRDNSLKPYLLTAAHCISSEAEARTVETFWTYQTSSCRGAVPALSASTTSKTGAHYLAGGSMQQGDYSMLLLQDVPPGVLYAGWDASDVAIGTNLAGIHHPAGSYKRILFGHRTADVLADVDGVVLPPESYYVVALDNGIAQPGSSGSPLFSSPGVIVGTLTWGPGDDGAVLCSAGSFDVGYGRFSAAYPALMNWLEDLPYSQVLPDPGEVRFAGRNGVIAGGPQRTVQLTTQSANPVNFSVRPDAPWIQVSNPATSTSASQPAPLTITINPKLLAQPKTYTGTVTILSGAAPPQYVNVRAEMTVDASNVSVSTDPNPVAQGADGLWSYMLQLRENAGVNTRVTLLRIDGRDYSGQIVDWFGSDSLPGGGLLETSLKARVLIAPVTQTIEAGGIDEGGRNWYRVFTVSLLGQ